MPIYEYLCRQCGKDFEKLIMDSKGARVVSCPGCGSEDIEKKPSAFGYSSGGAFRSSRGSSCEGCSATSCKTCK